jgi:putative redox protein
MYAERKGWPLEGVEMRLRHQKVKAEGQTVPIDEIDAEIRILGDLDEAQRERLLCQRSRSACRPFESPRRRR